MNKRKRKRLWRTREPKEVRSVMTYECDHPLYPDVCLEKMYREEGRWDSMDEREKQYYRNIDIENHRAYNPRTDRKPHS